MGNEEAPDTSLPFRAGARLCALPLAHVVETMRPLPMEAMASARACAGWTTRLPPSPVAPRDLHGASRSSRSARRPAVRGPSWSCSAGCRRSSRCRFAQDEATSVIYGMPREAANLGAAERVLPLGDIAGAIASLGSGRRREP